MSRTRSNPLPKQLSLSVHLNDEATFDNFFIREGQVNAQVVATLKYQLQPMGEQFVFLWGATGVGVTHLLQASCLKAQQEGACSQYLPLTELVGYDPEQLLEDLERLDLVCLDGLQAVQGLPEWERALFRFFNVMRDSGRRLVMAANCGPRELSVNLPDLQSRLNWGLVYQVQPLRDDDKCRALQMRARARGLELSDEVAQFIMHRVSRDLHELFECLHRLDDASLAEQRRLTIPFVKQTLGL
ncbi:DnaA regulatory inactivator Hda [Pseudomaricurvus alkylphenolicus]|jgi:DnaA family protein|uniref:DnaA regulatory inactivator Hda n=1 Tax=Pseudomaricurvus alkylphenolicus TaxID=1306991 RepID=UPI0014248725|nr:DnaA regulatory inactivator Hda [Pseudomaricurvus alkylphenolicus]NIB41981.1 DnaA regulatory inactivator Hda [Pseudomaricurvus alkylphenolicus]